MTFYDKSTQREIDSLPPSIPWGTGVKRNIPDAPITPEQYAAAGFVPIHPDLSATPIPDGYEVAPGGRELIHRKDGDMQEVLTLRTVAEGDEMRALAAKAARVEAYAMTTEYTAPLLDGHPDPIEVPATGMFYRIEDEGNITLWFARQNDLISTQLSSHDARGHRVMAEINLRTRESVTVDMDAWIDSLPPGLKRAVVRRGQV